MKTNNDKIHAIRNGLASVRFSLEMVLEAGYSREEYEMLVRQAFEAVGRTIEHFEALECVLQDKKEEK